MSTTKSKAWNDAAVAVLTSFAEAQENEAITLEQCKELTKNETLAGKTENMIRSKAVSLGIYQKAEQARKVGNPSATRKIELVNALETLMSLPKGKLASFEKSSKPELQAAVDALTTMSAQHNAEQGLKE